MFWWSACHCLCHGPSYRKKFRPQREKNHNFLKNALIFKRNVIFFFPNINLDITNSFILYWNFGGAVGAQNVPKKSKNYHILSSTFETAPRLVLYINIVVVLTLLMTHFMKYICIKHIRRGKKVSIGKTRLDLRPSV